MTVGSVNGRWLKGRRGEAAEGPLTAGRRGAGLAGLVPGFADVVGAAAHFLGHVEGKLVLTGVVVVAVAEALSHV